MYCVYKYVVDGEVWYVGKSKCLDMRIQQHQREKRFAPILPYCKIYYAELLNSAEMTIFETALINNLQPKLNVEMKFPKTRYINIDFSLLEWEEYMTPLTKQISKVDWFRQHHGFLKLSDEEKQKIADEYDKRYGIKHPGTRKPSKPRRLKGEGSWSVVEIKGTTYQKFTIAIDGRKKQFYGHSKAEAWSKYKSYMKTNKSQ